MVEAEYSPVFAEAENRVALKTNKRPGHVRSAPGQKEVEPMRISHTSVALTSPDFICCVCRKPLTREQLLDFSCRFACERGVRDYYRHQEPGIADQEVQLRRGNAASRLLRLRSRPPRGGDL